MRKGLGRHNYRSAGGPQPSLVLDFAGTGTLDPRVTFTRSTTGTYYNSSGVLTTAAINAPRFDYNPSTLALLGLLIEQSSTNILLNSNYGGAQSNGLTVINNSVTSIDGTTTATTVTQTSATSSHNLYTSFTAITNTNYTHSVFIKAGTNRYVSVGIGNFTGQAFITVDTTTFTSTQTITQGSGVTYVSSSIVISANGFYRISLTANCISVGLACIVGLNNTSTPATADASFSGNGTSNAYVTGAQLEALAFPTSYIPTTSAQVTRASDNASMTGTNFSSWYNTSQGTWFAQVNMLSTAGTPRIVGATPSSKAPMEISNQAAAMFDNVFGVSTANNITANTTQKIATVWTGTTGQVCLNGGTVATGSQLNGYADLSTIGIGYNSTSNNNFINGRIAKITYYPTVLNSAQLQALTT